MNSFFNSWTPHMAWQYQNHEVRYVCCDPKRYEPKKTVVVDERALAEKRTRLLALVTYPADLQVVFDGEDRRLFALRPEYV